MGKSVSILLADDDVDDVLIFRSAIDDSGYNCDIVHLDNGESFMHFIKNPTFSPDFVFIDINMPKINGITCLRFLTQQQVFPTASIYLLSTSNNNHDIKESYNLGADLYIRKPYSYAELVKILKMVLDKNYIQTRKLATGIFVVLDSRQLVD